MLFWLEDFAIFGVIIALLFVALGVYVLVASEKSMERLAKVMFLFS